MHALGIDFGTSNTVAVARWPDGRARTILVDGSPLMPSAVYAENDGQLAVGRDAVYSARVDPTRFEPNPKRRVDDGTVLLGEREFPVLELVSAVLARVAEEWRRAAGPVDTEVTLTCPATWGSTRRRLLADAAGWAGLAGARLVAEPVAAATYFAEVLGRDVPVGSVVVVHDFGAGTFDASVVARTAEGFQVLAVDGRDDIGGLDVDAAIVDHLRAAHPDADWSRIVEPATMAEQRARRQLWDDARVAKERLSRSQSADLVVPLLDLDLRLTRDELETVARPVLAQTVGVTERLLRWADLPDGRLAGVFLVGGASRIPLVATLLSQALGETPVVIEQPELVVAEGSVLAGAALLTGEPAAPGPTAELRLFLDQQHLFVRSSDTPPAVVEEPAGGSGPRPAAGPEPDSPDDGASPATHLPVESAAPAAPTSPPAPPSRLAPPEAAPPPAPSPIPIPAPVGAIDNRETLPGLKPAVDPWPDAPAETWEPDPDQTVPQLPPLSPAWNPGWSAGGPAVPTPRPAPAVAAPPPVPVAAAARRPGGFVRFLQVLLSVVLLIVVPLFALLLAYRYRTGETFARAFDELTDGVRGWFGAS